MEPLKTFFSRLKTTQRHEIITALREGKNLKGCDFCKQTIFNHPQCPRCPFSKKFIKDILIEEHIPLVMKISKTLAKRAHRHEACSVGLLALTKAIANLPSDIRNLGGFIRVWVTKEIKKFLIEKNSVIIIPWYAQKEYGYLQRNTKFIDESFPVKGEQGLVDLYELIDQIPKNKNEKIVMKCVIEGGYSLNEMAEICKTHPSRISQLKQDLLLRLYKNIKLLEQL